jgi:hypothetical protein
MATRHRPPAAAVPPAPRETMSGRASVTRAARATPLRYDRRVFEMPPKLRPPDTRGFHVLLGLGVLATYLYALRHAQRWLPGLAAAGHPLALGMGRAGRGFGIVLALPFAAVVCFLFPGWLKRAFSPRTPPLYDYLLTEGFWYAVGYSLLAVALGVFALFR